MLPKRLLKDRYIHQGMAYSFTIAGTYFLVLYFLPIYFQVIDNVSPIQSGVRNLPLIIAITLATIVSGVGITVTGRPMPFMIVAGVLSTVGVGLLFTLTIGSSSAKWIGYQVLAGLGLGLGFQVPVSAVQATLPQIDIPSGSAMIICESPKPGLLNLYNYTNMIPSRTNHRRRLPCLGRRGCLRICPNEEAAPNRSLSRPSQGHRYRCNGRAVNLCCQGHPIHSSSICGRHPDSVYCRDCAGRCMHCHFIRHEVAKVAIGTGT